MSDEKKIIIDEDWKSQVAAEKEALAEEHTDLENEPPHPVLPPASFELLLTSLATEAMISLGQMPSFGSQELEINLDQARYAIDMLQVLEDKTKGNLTPQEAGAVTDLLHQLRMMFVAVQQQSAKTPPNKGE